MVLKKSHLWDIVDWPWMENDAAFYSVSTEERWEFPWENIYVYDENGNLVLSLEDENEPQYFFALYERFLILDSGTSASQREMLVYEIPSWKVVYRTEYYPWKSGLQIGDGLIEYYKKVNENEFASLPECDNEYDNGYIEKYWYDIWSDMDADLWDVQCAYFE